MNRSSALLLAGLVAWTAAAGHVRAEPLASTNDWSETDRAFREWQAEMMKEREAIERRHARLLHARMTVPPPLPPSSPGSVPSLPPFATDPARPPVRLDIPLPFPTDARLTLYTGAPSFSFRLYGEAGFFSLVGASYKAGVTYSGADNKWLVGSAKDFQMGHEAGPVKITGRYQYDAVSWSGLQPKAEPDSASGDLSFDLRKIKGALG